MTTTIVASLIFAVIMGCLSLIKYRYTRILYDDNKKTLDNLRYSLDRYDNRLSSLEDRFIEFINRYPTEHGEFNEEDETNDEPKVKRGDAGNSGVYPESDDNFNLEDEKISEDLKSEEEQLRVAKEFPLYSDRIRNLESKIERLESELACAKKSAIIPLNEVEQELVNLEEISEEVVCSEFMKNWECPRPKEVHLKGRSVEIPDGDCT